MTDNEMPKIDPTRIPAHIAVIMDGNGRWARRQGHQRTDGHVAGVETVRRVIECSARIGVRYLTLYAFSTENWNRPREEVDMLWNLIISVLEKETPGLIKNNVRLLTIGDTDRLPESSRRTLEECIARTSHCTGLQTIIALSYSSRWEITRAARLLAEEARNGSLDPDRIDEKMFASRLTTAAIPDPDLLIRTGGEVRVSNFLLWQIAYSELYFTDVYWPDFSEADLLAAIADYQSRERRYGKTSDQVKQ